MSAKRRRRRESKRIQTKRVRKELQRTDLTKIGNRVHNIHYGDGPSSGELAYRNEVEA